MTTADEKMRQDFISFGYGSPEDMPACYDGFVMAYDKYSARIKELEQQNEQLQDKVNRLVHSLGTIANGIARQTRKEDTCSHGQYGYEHCESCLTDFAAQAILPEDTQTAEAYKRRIQADVVFAVKEELYGYKNHTSDEIFIDTVIELIDGIKELKGE